MDNISINITESVDVVKITATESVDVVQITISQALQGEKGVKGDDSTVPGPPGSDATVTKVAVEAVLTGEISTHSHTGGGFTQQIAEGLI